MSTTMHVRLKPFDKRRGHVLRCYTIYGVRFLEKRGWYEVPTSLAKKLEVLPQRVGDDNSPMAFDVKTKDEAEVADHEAKVKVERRQAKDANPVRVRETRMPDEPDDDPPPARASKPKRKPRASSK